LFPLIIIEVKTASLLTLLFFSPWCPGVFCVPLCKVPPPFTSLLFRSINSRVSQLSSFLSFWYSSVPLAAPLAFFRVRLSPPLSRLAWTCFSHLRLCRQKSVLCSALAFFPPSSPLTFPFSWRTVCKKFYSSKDLFFLNEHPPLLSLPFPAIPNFRCVYTNSISTHRFRQRIIIELVPPHCFFPCH